MKYITEMLVTFPTEEKAKEICLELIQEKLAACANIFPVQSVYHWQSQMHQEAEWAATLKTLPEKLDQVTRKIKSLHPYEVPGITWWEVKSTEEYINWVSESVT